VALARDKAMDRKPCRVANCAYITCTLVFGWSRVGGAVRRAEGLHKGRFTFWRDDVVGCGGFGHIRVLCGYAGVRASGRLVEGFGRLHMATAQFGALCSPYAVFREYFRMMVRPVG
jgi:hypothetical protein